MRTRNLFLGFGLALALSFGIFVPSKGASRVSADSKIDLGTIKFSEANPDSAANYIYGINNVANEAPAAWESDAFHPVDEESGTFVDGVRVGTEIKKILPYTYYIPTPGAKVGSVATVKGTWENNTYKFTVTPFKAEWTGSKWENVVELEAYDTITLSDICFDDKDRESFDTTGLAPKAWNTFVTSSENTRNSFAFKFEYESYTKLDKSLDIKIGGSGEWDTGHFYHLVLNNAWGGASGGAIFLYERLNGSAIYSSGEINRSLQPGARHTIEFGSIYIKESNDTYDYVIYDGETIFSKINEPKSHNRTTKVGCYYGGTNIFFGSSEVEPKVNDQILKYNFLAEGKKGIYLDGSLNDIPFGWEVKGVPASKNNALLNGEPMYKFGTSSLPLVKFNETEENGSYYLALVDGDINVDLKEGDVITLSGDYHFYTGGKAYLMSVMPVSLLYQKNQIKEISNIYTYLMDQIENHCDPDYYNEDGLLLIEAIIEESKTELPKAKSMVELWDLYKGYIAELDEIPYDEEKAKEILNNAKEQAILELNALVDPDNYTDENLLLVQKIVADAIDAIELDSTDTVAKVNEIVIEAHEEVAKIQTKREFIEEAVLNAERLEDVAIYLADYERVTTTDLSAIGSMVFSDYEGGNSYHSGGYDDTTTRIATSSENVKGNMIFQFVYESDCPSARCLTPAEEEFGAQIFIRMRGSDVNAYRFDIATATGDDDNAGVALTSFINDVAVDRIKYNAKLQANTPYEIECGAIDLDGYDRTLLFMNIEGETVLKTIVDSLEESRPTIAIRDSYVAAPHTATLSPLEKGVSKTSYSTLLGRLILDESSNKDLITATLRDNDIPVETELYPVENGAFTLNGEDVGMINSRPATSIRKTGQNKYLISIQDHKFEDGDVISIGGYFGSYNANTMVKSIYRLFDATLVYDAEADKWSQTTPTDPETIVYEAKETIRNYVDLANYSVESAEVVEGLITEYIARVDAVPLEEVLEQVPAIVEEALREIDKVNTLLDDYKASAKAELRDYRSPSLYRDEEKAELAEILADAYEEIDNCNDFNAIDVVVSQTKIEIDALKTAEQRDAEDLENAKKAARSEVESYSSLLELQRYSDENATLLVNLTHTTLDVDIKNATSIEQVNEIVSVYKEAVKKVQTKDGSTFDGEKYIEPAPKGGCGGSIETVSVLSFVALFAAATLIIVKKLKEN